MNTTLKPLQVREMLIQKKTRLFTVQDFENLFQTTPTKAKYFLETQVDNGLLIRLKKGMYALKGDLPREEAVANRLYRPSYISFEYALAYYGIMPEMPYMVTSATPKPTRLFTVDGTMAYMTFAYYTIKEEAYTGYRVIGTQNSILEKGKKIHLSETNKDSFFIAVPEKALVDFLYFVSIGKREMNDRLDTATLDKDKIVAYAKLFDRKKLNELIKEYL